MTTTTVPRSSAAETRRAIWNTIRGSSGNLVEWYDVYVYTVFATYFEGQFFDESEKNSTVYVYAIFAITFVMRPDRVVVLRPLRRPARPTRGADGERVADGSCAR